MGEEVPYRLTAVSEDDRVLALRSEGRSFGRIAKTVGLADGRAALDAFHRSLRRQAPDKRAALRRAELARLAQLSVHLDHCASFGLRSWPASDRSWSGSGTCSSSSKASMIVRQRPQMDSGIAA